MAYVQVPKDLTRVKTKVMFNLTKRQLVCFGSGGAVGVLFYLLTKDALGTTVAASIMIMLVLPFFMFAIYEKDGRPLEKILMNIIRTKFLVPGIRPYRTENMYAYIQREIYEQEVLGIGTEKETEAHSTGKGRFARGKNQSK
jgi:hypothetical protein